MCLCCKTERAISWVQRFYNTNHASKTGEGNITVDPIALSNGNNAIVYYPMVLARGHVILGSRVPRTCSPRHTYTYSSTVNYLNDNNTSSKNVFFWIDGISICFVESHSVCRLVKTDELLV